MRESAAAHDIAAFTALVHAENQPMRRFFMRLGANGAGFDAGALRFRLKVSDIISRLSGAFEFEALEG